MDLVDKLKTLATRISQQSHHTQSEEATKTAFILPFINVLGYDFFDPSEVVPEFVADVANKRGEKVDYAILKDGEPIIILECKQLDSDLNLENASQLYRYFTTTKARFGVLTNGVIYRFYSDLDEINKMDAQPFFEFDLLNFMPQAVDELKRFTKETFDLKETIQAANDLKYTTAIKRILSDQTRRPYEEFVRFLISQVYKGRMTKKVKEQFVGLTKEGLSAIYQRQG